MGQSSHLHHPHNKRLLHPPAYRIKDFGQVVHAEFVVLPGELLKADRSVGQVSQEQAGGVWLVADGQGGGFAEQCSGKGRVVLNALDCGLTAIAERPHVLSAQGLL